MSTAELFLEPDEADEFIRDTLATDGLVVIGDDGSEIGLCPYITFYNCIDTGLMPAARPHPQGLCNGSGHGPLICST